MQNDDPRGVFIINVDPPQNDLFRLLSALNVVMPLDNIVWVEDDRGVFHCRDCGCLYTTADHRNGCEFSGWGHGWLKEDK